MTDSNAKPADAVAAADETTAGAGAGEGKTETKPADGKPAEGAADQGGDGKGGKAADGAADKTAADLLGDDSGGEGKGNTVPEAAFLEEKNGRKAAEGRVKELETELARAREGGNISAGDVTALAKKYNVEESFVNDVLALAEDRATKKVEGKIEGEKAQTKKAAEAAERQKRIDSTFDTEFARVMENMPEYKDVVNRDVVKTLTLDPKNGKKTFRQIIEEAYPNAISGKRTVDVKDKPAAGKEAGEIDFDRAAKDTAYYAEIMADPTLKKKYNESLTGRIGSAL